MIVGLTALIIVLICAIGYFAINLNDGGADQASDYSSDSSASSTSSVNESSSTSSSESSSSESGEWKLIGSYSGSGSGSQAVSVPAGKIMVKITAYPIKNMLLIICMFLVLMVSQQVLIGVLEVQLQADMILLHMNHHLQKLSILIIMKL